MALRVRDGGGCRQLPVSQSYCSCSCLTGWASEGQHFLATFCGDDFVLAVFYGTGYLHFGSDYVVAVQASIIDTVVAVRYRSYVAPTGNCDACVFVRRSRGILNMP